MYYNFILETNVIMYCQIWSTLALKSHTIKSQLSASKKTNMHISFKPVWWDTWSQKWQERETHRSCDLGLFFSLGTLHLIDVDSPWTISIDKKKYTLWNPGYCEMQSSYVYTLMKMQRRLLCCWHMLALGPVQTSNFTCAEPNSWRKEISSLLLKIGK